MLIGVRMAVLAKFQTRKTESVWSHDLKAWNLDMEFYIYILKFRACLFRVKCFFHFLIFDAVKNIGQQKMIFWLIANLPQQGNIFWILSPPLSYTLPSSPRTVAPSNL
jgi:hypothetical protein